MKNPKIIGIIAVLAIFSIGIDYAFADFESTEPVITIQMDGPSKFYSTESNQIIRAYVEIQNYTPSDGLYFMKVTHIPTQTVLKDFEIYPKPSGNDLWTVKTAYPFLESDIKVGTQTLFGEYEIHIRTKNGSQTASTTFFIYEYRYGPESKLEPDPESQTQIDPPSLELDAGPSDESQKIPDWIKSNAEWWATDKISESEFLRAIEYLIENEIMKISIPENEDLPSITTTYSRPSSRSTEYVEITGSFTEKHVGALTLTIVKPDNSEEKITTVSRGGTFMTMMALTGESSLGIYQVFAEIEGNQILVSAFNVKDTDSKNVPEWIKNNADWWAQGLITDDDFVKGIQFLVEQGIIQIAN